MTDTRPKVPIGLASGGRALWQSITDDHDLDAVQLVQLTEACRAKDRLDKLDDILRGDVDTWAELVQARGEDETILEVRITGPLMKANETANLMKMLLAALRLPDEKTGKRPQTRTPRGSYSTGGSTRVSSLERARIAKQN